MIKLEKGEITILQKFLANGVVTQSQLINNVCLSCEDLVSLGIPPISVMDQFSNENKAYYIRKHDDKRYFLISGPILDHRRSIEDFENLVMSEYEKILHTISVELGWLNGNKGNIDLYFDCQGVIVKINSITFRRNNIRLKDFVFPIFRELFGKEPSDSLKLFLELKS